jgi:hypothetical protein
VIVLKRGIIHACSRAHPFYHAFFRKGTVKRRVYLYPAIMKRCVFVPVSTGTTLETRTLGKTFSILHCHVLKTTCFAILVSVGLRDSERENTAPSKPKVTLFGWSVLIVDSCKENE